MLPRRCPSSIHAHPAFRGLNYLAARGTAAVLCAGVLTGCFVDLVYFTACSPDPTVWNQSLATAGRDDAGRVVAEASNGDLVVAGNTSSALDFFDVLLIRTDAEGNRLWTRTYGSGPENEQAVRAAFAPNRDILILATSGHEYDALHRADYYLIRTDDSGTVLWEQRFGGDRNDVAVDFAVLPDGAVVLGTTESAGSGGRDLELLRLDTTGGVLWSHTYGGAADDKAVGLLPTADGGYALLGTTESYGTGGAELYLAKTGANGEELWFEFYSSPRERKAVGFEQASDGGFVLAGNSGGAPFLLKTDAAGRMAWERAVEIGEGRTVESLSLTGDGGIILASSGQGFCGARATLSKTDADGNLQWSRKYGSTLDASSSYDVIETRDGALVFTGDLSTFDDESFLPIRTVFLAKVNNDGR